MECHLKALGEENPYRDRGYRYYIETGYYYLQSRYYNPEWGRFLNTDALVSTGQGFIGYNMFAYCLNSPTSSKDYNGFICSSITEGIGTKDTKGVRDGIKSGSSWVQAIYDFGINLGKGCIHVVKNGTKAHSGKVMSYGAGITDAFIGKSKYILSETIDAFKGSIKGFAAVGLAASATSNYIEYDGNIKHAAIGWAVDSLAGVLIGAVGGSLLLDKTVEKIKFSIISGS